MALQGPVALSCRFVSQKGIYVCCSTTEKRTTRLRGLASSPPMSPTPKMSLALLLSIGFYSKVPAHVAFFLLALTFCVQCGSRPSWARSKSPTPRLLIGACCRGPSIRAVRAWCRVSVCFSCLLAGWPAAAWSSVAGSQAMVALSDVTGATVSFFQVSWTALPRNAATPAEWFSNVQPPTGLQRQWFPPAQQWIEWAE